MNHIDKESFSADSRAETKTRLTKRGVRAIAATALAAGVVVGAGAHEGADKIKDYAESLGSVDATTATIEPGSTAIDATSEARDELAQKHDIDPADIAGVVETGQTYVDQNGMPHGGETFTVELNKGVTGYSVELADEDNE